MGMVERMGGGTGGLTMSLKRSFPPVAGPATRLLILGSLPGERSLAEARYYAHPQNQFWRLLGTALAIDLAAMPYPDRLDVLSANRVGLWDVVATARRHGSSDAAIRDPAANDIATLVAQLPDLRAVAFNGGTAARHGIRLIPPGITTITLPSSSPLHTIGITAKQPAWSSLAAYLTD